MHNIVVIGSSGHSRVIIDILESDTRYKIVGLIDSFRAPKERVNGYEILGDEKRLSEICKEHTIYGGVIAIGDNWNRQSMYESIREHYPAFNFIKAVHKSAIISNSAIIGDGTVVSAGAIINPNSVIGEHCIVNTGAIVDHDCFISDFASMAPGVVLGGSVSVGNKSAVGIGCSIIEKTHIEEESIIGAHSLVLENVPAQELWFGVPAKFVKKNNPVIKYLK